MKKEQYLAIVKIFTRKTMSNKMNDSIPNHAAEHNKAKKQFHHRAVSYEEETQSEPKCKHARLDNDEILEAQELDQLEALISANNALRRQVQILHNVPDEIIAFDLDGNIRFSNSSYMKSASFWEMATPSSTALIQTGINNALVEDAQEDGSWPLFGGRSVSLQLLFKGNHDVQVTRLVSLKGTIYLYDERPECVVTIRPLAATTDNVVSDTSVCTKES